MYSGLKEIYLNLDQWIRKNDFKSYDICDVKGLAFYLKLSEITHGSKYGKYFSYPIQLLIDRNTSAFRSLFKVQRSMYPQAQALIARSYLKYFQKYQEESFLHQALHILEWLKKNPSPGYAYLCWGQPYHWFSGKVIPAFTPRTTVTSQVATAFLDAYEITQQEELLAVAGNTCGAYSNVINEMCDQDGDICFSYTSIDRYHIHNASMMAATVLIRTGVYKNDQALQEKGLKALAFTMKHQNQDGSWFYWAPPDKIKGKIDNYHTGFVLESLETIRRSLNVEFRYNEALEKGLDYYLNNFYQEGVIPKMRPYNTYPIDIQSCAQSIITMSELGHLYPSLNEKKEKIMQWTLENMLDPEGYFYYRIYKNRRVDKSPYIRWAESWMMLALAHSLPKGHNHC